MSQARPPCEICGSTSFYDENAIIVCHNGHQQEGGQQIGEDDADYFAAGKKSRKREAKDQKKVSRIFRGVKGFRLFLQSWQLIMWKQCHSLIYEHGLPTELWKIVSQLWTIQLTILNSKLEIDSLATENGSRVSSGPSSPNADSEVQRHLDKPSSDIVVGAPLKLSDTIALNYLGILLLRYPMPIARIYTMVREERLCYIRAIRYIPPDMKEHLAPEYFAALDTLTVPDQYDLQLTITKLALFYNERFGMAVPSLNWKPMLFQHIRNLALPIEIFSVAKLIAELVKYSFSYNQTSKIRNTILSLPEGQLMATVVVATKLLFPIDPPTDSDSHSTYKSTELRMDWQAWYDSRRNSSCSSSLLGSQNHNPISPGNEIEVTDTDVMGMDESELDQYMDWFQRTFTNDKHHDGIQKQLLDMFPLDELNTSTRSSDMPDDTQSSTEQQLRLSLSARLPQRNTNMDQLAESATTRHSSQRYPKYQSSSDLDGPALQFHTEAAKLASLSLEQLLKAVISTERSLLLYQHELRREQVFQNDFQRGMELD